MAPCWSSGGLLNPLVGLLVVRRSPGGLAVSLRTLGRFLVGSGLSWSSHVFGDLRRHDTRRRDCGRARVSRRIWREVLRELKRAFVEGFLHGLMGRFMDGCSLEGLIESYRRASQGFQKG